MLDEIVANKRLEISRVDDGSLEPALLLAAAEIQRPPVSLAEALTPHAQANIIAEVKRRSPSAGDIADLDPVEQAVRYAEGGAAAISVLTDLRYFGGTTADLANVVLADVGIPILRKDFIVDERQVLESRAIGADSLLLIVAALSRMELEHLLFASRALDMEPLVETHTRDELDTAISVGATVIGINNRDLHSFNTELSRTEELAPLVPDDCVVVSESGIRTPEDIARLREFGVHSFLIGETLMRSDDPESTIETLRNA